MCCVTSRGGRNETTLRNFMFQAQGEYFDLTCESLSIASQVIREGFNRKWPLPGGMPLLLELLPTVFLHIFRVLCVHKLEPSISKTVIGHAYSFRPTHVTLLAPSSLERAMLEKQIPLTSRALQVQAEPSCQWSAAVPYTVVDCISLLRVLRPLPHFCFVTVFWFCSLIIVV